MSEPGTGDETKKNKKKCPNSKPGEENAGQGSIGPEGSDEGASAAARPRLKVANILLTNVTSILGDGRRKNTKYKLEHSDADIIMLTESNLNEDVLDQTIEIVGFKLVTRCDRKLHTRNGEPDAQPEVESLPGVDDEVIVGTNSQGNPVTAEKRKKSGGGVLLFAKDTLLPTNKNKITKHRINTCMDRVQIAGYHVKGLLVICVYNAIFALYPDLNHSKMFSHLTEIITNTRKSDPNCKIIVGGDWNRPTLINENTFEDVGMDGGAENSIERMFYDFLGEHDLVVGNSSNTRNDKVLDIFFVSRDVMDNELTVSDTESDFYNMRYRGGQ